MYILKQCLVASDVYVHVIKALFMLMDMMVVVVLFVQYSSLILMSSFVS